MLRQKHLDRQVDESERDAKVSELRKALGPLSERTSIFCTNACLRRYLEARNWNIDKAKEMLQETLRWRSSFRPEEIRWPEIAEEGEKGLVFRANFHDRSGRTVLIMRPGLEKTALTQHSIRGFVYHVENAILNLPQGQEQMIWLVDFTGWKLSTRIPIKLASDIISIVQNHYPERLALAFLYKPPKIFETFYKALKYFLEPKNAQNMKFVYPENSASIELMRSYFDVENLPKEFGGRSTLKYDHVEFTRMMEEDDVKTAMYWGLDK